MKNIRLLLSLAAVLMMPAHVNAGEVEDLKAQMAEMQKMLNQMSARIQSLEKAEESAPKITFAAAPTITSADGNFSLQVTGKFQTDTAFASDGNTTDRSNSSKIRRAEFGVKGTMYKDWSYKFIADLQKGGVNLNDVYLGYNGFDFVSFKLGQTYEPYSLETAVISSGQTTFLEKGGSNVFAPGRSIGIKATGGGDFYSWAIGAYGGSHSADDSLPDGGDQRNAVTARITAAPINDDGKVLHLGIAGSHRTVGSTGTVTYSAKPGTTFGGSTVSTGAIAGANTVNLLGLEAIGIWDSFSLVGEYGSANVDTTTGDFTFDGYYVTASYFLTGETRPYSASKGNITRLKPLKNFGIEEGGWGAWEIAFRHDYIDLNDGTITGGTMDTNGVALNWYLNPNLRLMMDYIQADASPTATSSDDSGIFMLRAQFDF